MTPRPPYTRAQLSTGRRVVNAALARGYSLTAAHDITRTYVNNTPTLPRKANDDA